VSLALDDQLDRLHARRRVVTTVVLGDGEQHEPAERLKPIPLNVWLGSFNLLFNVLRSKTADLIPAVRRAKPL
jgi:hypothetical protein